MLLAIESSCDETAVALLDISKYRDGALLSDCVCSHVLKSQVKLHQPYGGVVPELASRNHISILPIIVNQAIKDAGVTLADISHIAVTRGPGLNGCLLVGLNYAKALAYTLGANLVGVNHLEGHLHAVYLNESIEKVNFPALALLVSGGHTSILKWSENHTYELLANTRDDAAGEAFDKIGTLVGLPYPAGPLFSKLGEEGDVGAYQFPIAMRDDVSAFSFSGFKTAAQRYIAEDCDISVDSNKQKDFAASVQYSIVQNLLFKLESHITIHKPSSIILAGGVAANSYLRKSFAELGEKYRLTYSIVEKQYCTDNAVMIAAVAANRIVGKFCENTNDYSINSLPRWSVQ